MYLISETTKEENRIKANRLFSILAGIVSVVVIGLLGFLLFANR